MGTQQECRKKNIWNFQWKIAPLTENIASIFSRVLSTKQFLMQCLKQYKESLNIERKHGNGRKKKRFADQNKANTINTYFSKTP